MGKAGIFFKAAHAQAVKRYALFFTTLITAGLVIIHSCDENNDYDHHAKPKESYTNTIFESYSPDKTELLTLIEQGCKGERGYTQVLIEFKGASAGKHQETGP